ncbi:hypothetical protein EVAR_88053_1 [Eumeta japonica]|uniref:Uncharacterized protein n=1 Tax=Eumeta variegata TaxID=151549 RepID=A0A4C1VDV1_EUMVA|nr:hypothetical protein EVAR_88053_1 [Eumeta japonica]
MGPPVRFFLLLLPARKPIQPCGQGVGVSYARLGQDRLRFVYNSTTKTQPAGRGHDPDDPRPPLSPHIRVVKQNMNTDKLGEPRRHFQGQGFLKVVTPSGWVCAPPSHIPTDTPDPWIRNRISENNIYSHIIYTPLIRRLRIATRGNGSNLEFTVTYVRACARVTVSIR